MLHSTQSSGSIEIPMEERTSTPWIRLHMRWAFHSLTLPRKYQTRIDVGCVFEFSSQKRDAGGASAPTTLPNHARPYLTSWENRCRGGGACAARVPLWKHHLPPDNLQSLFARLIPH